MPLGIALSALLIALALTLLPDDPHLADAPTSVAPIDQPKVAPVDSVALSPKAKRRETQAATVRPSIPDASATQPTGEAARHPDGETMAQEVTQLASTAPDDLDQFPASADQQQSGLSISGRVLDETGQPLPGIVLTLRPIHLFDSEENSGLAGHLSSAQEQSAFTDFDGSYVFWGLADGEYEVKTTGSEGFAPVSTTVRAGVTSADLVLTWQREIVVSGVVQSTDGTPLDSVQVVTSSSTGPSSSSVRVAHTDSFGNFALKVRLTDRDEAVAVRFKQDGYKPQMMELTEADLDGSPEGLFVNIYLEPEASLATVTGRLRGPNGRPVSGEPVQLTSHKLGRSYQAVSDQAGRFFIPSVEPGPDYTLNVYPKTRYKDYKNRSLQIPARGLDLDIELETADLGRIEGQMVDLDNNPVPRFTLTVKSRSASRQSVQVTGDGNGYFVVEDVPEGPVIFKTTSFPKFTIVGLQASRQAGEPVTVILDVGKNELRGQVVDGTGAPVAAADITLSLSIDLSFSYEGKGGYSVSSRKTVSDASGYFQFSGLSSGRYVVRVEAPGFETAELKHHMLTRVDKIVIRLDES